ncbi:MAG: DUF308 domain-containing protein [Mycobacterium sp.]
MLIIALVLALIGLVALVFAVVTSNELVAWVCIGASVFGVILLIIDAVQERQHRDTGAQAHDEEEAAGENHETRDAEDAYVDYPEEAADEHKAAASHETSEEADADSTEESAVPAEGRGDEPAK